jgi:hypothetical protein
LAFAMHQLYRSAPARWACVGEPGFGQPARISRGRAAARIFNPYASAALAVGTICHRHRHRPTMARLTKR